MAKKRDKKLRDVTTATITDDSPQYDLQCPFCFEAMRLSKRRLRAGGFVLTFRCGCGTKIEAVFEPDGYVGSFWH